MNKDYMKSGNSLDFAVWVSYDIFAKGETGDDA